MSGEAFSDAVIETLRGILPPSQEPIPLHQPSFKGSEWTYVKECLDTGWVSSAGKFVDRFEKELSEYTTSPFAVACCNGTAALHICLLLSEVERGDEVLLPALTFVATANAVSYCGAIPHFVDSEERTLGVDPEKLLKHLSEIAEVRGNECFNRKTGRRIRALVAMHTFGCPVDLDPIAEICQRFKIHLIEDAAESLGSTYKGRHTGNIGRVSALSFNGNKIITTGGGGAVLTADKKLAEKAKHLTTTAKSPHPYLFNHDELGYNYRMPNINAALGCAQLEQIDGFLAAKRLLASKYEKIFSGLQGLKVFTPPTWAKSNFWLNTVILDHTHTQYRDEILKTANAAEILARPVWTLMHKLPMFKSAPRMDLSTAESLELRILNFPSSPSLVGEVSGNA
ncbi:LegC family aminotransferase [bacterium]|nr:LegC family aminotransferase [bacterium]